jgi:hypothetical protein
MRQWATPAACNNLEASAATVVWPAPERPAIRRRRVVMVESSTPVFRHGVGERVHGPTTAHRVSVNVPLPTPVPVFAGEWGSGYEPNPDRVRSSPCASLAQPVFCDSRVPRLVRSQKGRSVRRSLAAGEVEVTEQQSQHAVDHLFIGWTDQPAAR